MAERMEKRMDKPRKEGDARREVICAGVDVGTECVKVLVLRGGSTVIGRSVVPTGGYFQDIVRGALHVALDEAQVTVEDLGGLCATGFGVQCVPEATMSAGETACHALGAWHRVKEALTVVDIGGREPKVIHVDSVGRPVEIHTLRRCAVGLGTFLIFASRHLDVHPTQLQELAARVDDPAAVGSYCSVFANSDILDRLREGYSREAIALGCMYSVAERVAEIGGFRNPLHITGGIAEYFPGVVKALGSLVDLTVELVPEPIQAGALGAAIKAHQATGAGMEMTNTS
jgi:predicted CoA-substrate-specific enzyme activase